MYVYSEGRYIGTLYFPLGLAVLLTVSIKFLKIHAVKTARFRLWLKVLLSKEQVGNHPKEVTTLLAPIVRGP